MISPHAQIDPEQTEPNTLFQLTGPLTDKRILEIGCGDGRLTWRYAYTAGEVVGIDPNEARIEKAQLNTPLDVAHTVSFHAADIFAYKATDPFDIALLSWSL